MKWNLFRIFIPTWRFFDAVGARPELFVFQEGKWEAFLEWPQIPWYALLFNPNANFFHACNNLLERLVIEINEGLDPAGLTSFHLVQDLVGDSEFKITVNGEDILHSRRTAG